MTIPPETLIIPERKRSRMRMGRAIGALILREVSTTYGRSVGGYLWAILDPVLGIAFLTLIFAMAIDISSPPLGKNFALFYASGLLPFQVWSQISQKVGRSVQYSKQMIGYPRITFIDMVAARFLLNSATNLAVSAIVFTGIIGVFNLPANISVTAAVFAFLITAFFGLSVGTVNCYLFLAFPTWEQVWGIATRPLFIISGIFFIFEDLPENARNFLWYNPLVHIIGLTRMAIYPQYNGSFVSIKYLLAISGVLTFIGLLLSARRFRDLQES